MAAVYKTIKRWRGITYVLIQNRWNSKKCFVEAYDSKTNQDLYGVVKIDNKTSEIEWLVTKSSIPKQVIEAIESVA